MPHIHPIVWCYKVITLEHNKFIRHNNTTSKVKQPIHMTVTCCGNLCLYQLLGTIEIKCRYVEFLSRMYKDVESLSWEVKLTRWQVKASLSELKKSRLHSIKFNFLIFEFGLRCFFELLNKLKFLLEMSEGRLRKNSYWLQCRLVIW